MVPTASGDGFTASQGALDAASDAAETMWWWEQDADDGQGGGVWRTRAEAVTPGAGVKTPANVATKIGENSVGGGGASPWTPWSALLDTSEAPYFRWFVGARTNACFNAVDRHLLDGRGGDVALTCLPEDNQRSPGGVGDAARYSVTRRELAGAVAAAAAQLRDVHDLRPRDRVLFHMPTDAVHFAYMLACQRLGVTYSATAVDSVEDVLASRVEDLRPKLVVAAEAPVVHGGVEIDCAAKLRRAAPNVAMLLVKPWRAASPLQKKAAECASMTDERAFVAVAKLAPPLPCAADHPLFVSYTSGSTGKPKGVVHGHGGYVAGVLASMVSRMGGGG